MSSAQDSFQPAGPSTVASVVTVAASRPCGSSTNRLKGRIASCSLLVVPVPNTPLSVGSPESSAMSRCDAPGGTVTLSAYMLRGSRCQASGVPLARITSPIIVSSGPVGPCSPGIHFGNASVSGPAPLTASVRSVCTCLALRSRASTRSVRSAARAAPHASSSTASSMARIFDVLMGSPR